MSGDVYTAGHWGEQAWRGLLHGKRIQQSTERRIRFKGVEKLICYTDADPPNSFKLSLIHAFISHCYKGEEVLPKLLHIYLSFAVRWRSKGGKS